MFRLKKIAELEKALSEDTVSLAIYLCEDPKKFTLSICCQIVSEFQKKFLKAVEENQKREDVAKKR